MQRRRAIAASPLRASTEAWIVIEEVISATLGASPRIDSAEVRAALQAAKPVGQHLVAGGYLRKSPIILVADPLRLEITTVHGDEALRHEEDATKVAGAAEATDWMIHLPTPDPLAQVVREVAKSNKHLSSETPSEPTEAHDNAAQSGGIDRDALRRRRVD